MPPRKRARKRLGKRSRKAANLAYNGDGPRPKRAKKNDNLSYEDNLRRIGGSTNDITYIDTISLVPSYPWYTMHPLPAAIPKGTESRGSRVSKLSTICVKAIAQEVDEIDEHDLEEIPSQWAMAIWKMVLKFQKDSFRNFIIFSSLLGQDPNFRCHLSGGSFGLTTSPLQTLSSNRNITTTLLSLGGYHNYDEKVEKKSRHRFENLFANVNAKDVVQKINRMSYRPLVFLDLSKAENMVSTLDIMMYLNIANLTGLNLSNSKVVDDQLIYNIGSKIKHGQLQSLKVLGLSGCPGVTEKAIRSLLDLSKDPTIFTSLLYIETEASPTKSGIRDKPSRDRYLDGTNWLSLEDRSSKKLLELARQPIGTKLAQLYTSYPSRVCTSVKYDSNAMLSTQPEEVTSLKETLKLDIMIYGESYSQADFEADKIRKLTSSWAERRATRLVQGETVNFKTAIMINHQYKPASSTSTTIGKPKNGTARRRPTIKADAKSFFGGSEA
ncbi:uncharacterized protein RJT20DRAFT_131215 [Scheffersomyces xylosifermentans]|uniref:uncharacterized protein n=1 Tax=Scheffersomyces xylosifermentans TaxID=1304137 RepID=UPI00315C7C4B